MKNNNVILVEYIKTIVSELKVDRAFVGNLLSAFGNKNNKINVTRIVNVWLKDVESYSDNKLSPSEKKSVIDFATSQYPKILKKMNNDSSMATKRLQHVLDLKFSALKLRLE